MPSKPDSARRPPVTSWVFRCRGLCPEVRPEDSFGLHDLLFWVLFLALGAGWYFGQFEPQRQRNEMLTGRAKVLESQLKEERVELERLKRESVALQAGHPAAWERAARAQLGWLMPGETVDLQTWRQEKLEAGEPDPLAPQQTDRPQATRQQPARRPAPRVRSAEAAPPPVAARQTRR